VALTALVGVASGQAKIHSGVTVHDSSGTFTTQGTTSFLHGVFGGETQVNKTNLSDTSAVSVTKFGNSTPGNEVVLADNYTATGIVEAEELRGIAFDKVNFQTDVAAPPRCSPLNGSSVRVPELSTRNYSVAFDCDPGSQGSPSLNIQEITNGNRYNYSTTLTVETNITKEDRITWRIDESNLENWGNRDGNPTYTVDGKSSDTTVIDGSGNVFATVQTDFGNSSLEAGSHSAYLVYESTDSPSGGAGGGGGGGGGGFDPEPGVSFENPTAPVNPGSTAVLDLEITNEQTVENTARVSVPAESSQPQCRYFDVEKNLGRESGFGDIGTYKLRDQGIAGRKYSTFFNIRVDLPQQSELDELDLVNGTLTCRFSTSSSEGEAGDLVVDVEPNPNPLASLGRGLSTGLFKFGGREVELTVCRDDLSQLVRPEQCGNRLVVGVPYSLIGVSVLLVGLGFWARRRG